MNEEVFDFEGVTRKIGLSDKKTPVTLYLKGEVGGEDLIGYEFYGAQGSHIIFCDLSEAEKLLAKIKGRLKTHRIIADRRNSAMPMLNTNELNARIEPGAYIREGVKIEENAVVLMGAVINTGSRIGSSSMIDMGAVIGSGAVVGKNCHIGANAVLAGMLEPAGTKPVILEDNVFVGACAVVLEGCRIGENAVVGAGSVVMDDIPAFGVAVGSPAKVVKLRDEKTEASVGISKLLRNI